MPYQNYAGVWLQESASVNNWINGTAATEYIPGTNGNDSFDGKGGLDTLAGGPGDDYYWLNGPGQQVVENPGQGTDTVRIWQSYILPANVENLIVFGTGSSATGNAQDNIIQGLDGSQFLYGGLGQDVLIGGAGADTFVIKLGEGNKVIQDFQSGADKVRLIGGDLSSLDKVKAAMTQQGSDVVLNDNGTMILFRNATIGQFSAQDFQLPLNYALLGAPTFSDDFNSLQLGTVWASNFGYAGTGLNSYTLPQNGELQLYTDATFRGTAGGPLGLNPFSLGNGVLTISAQPVSDATAANMWGYHYSSGMLTSAFTQTYGYFEMRAQLPAGQGLWPAFWLLGANNNEIDILEVLGSDLRTPENALHSNANPGSGMKNFLPDPTGFHTYGVMWSPSTLTFYIDGTEAWQAPTPSDMNVPMHMIANLAVGGNWAGAPDGTTPWPAQMKIDYVRVYNLPGAAPPSTPPPPPPPPADTGGSTGGGGTTSATTINQIPGYGQTWTATAAAETFKFTVVPWTPAHINGFQVGVDKLDVSALFLNGYAGSDPVADGYVRLANDTQGGTQVLVDVDGPGGAHPWPDFIVNLNNTPFAGLSWAALSGGAAGGSTGGGGTSSATTINQVPGYGQTWTATAAAETFKFTVVPWTPAHINGFQVGVDKLDVSALFLNGYAGSDPVADGYVRLADDTQGGTQVLVDVDGPGGAHPWPDYIVNLNNTPFAGLTRAVLSGGAGGGTTSGGGTAGVNLTASKIGDTLVGGAGNDTLSASRGYDVLTGGAGADNFVFQKEPWAPIEVTDFTPGVDHLDLRGFFGVTGYSGGDPFAARFLTLQSDGAGGTQVLFDPDGAATGHLWPDYIIHLAHVAPTSLHLTDFLLV
jgi:beta-glucanase (GH16 family)